MITNPDPLTEHLLIVPGLEDITDEEWELALERARHSTLIDRHVYRVPHLAEPQKN